MHVCMGELLRFIKSKNSHYHTAVWGRFPESKLSFQWRHSEAVTFQTNSKHISKCCTTVLRFNS